MIRRKESIDGQIAETGNARARQFKRDGIAVLEERMEAGRRWCRAAAVRYSVDQKTTSAADSSRQSCSKQRGLALGLEIFVEQIGISRTTCPRHALHLVGGECTRRLGVLLSPDLSVRFIYL